MNPRDVEAFFARLGYTFNSLPKHPFKKEWADIKHAIEPHFYGNIPTALEKAFPNEDPAIAEYRKGIYSAKTMSPVVKATTELLRLLSSSKHSVYFENENMQQWYENASYMDKDVFSYFFDVILPYRVLDPNAVGVVIPNGRGIEEDNVKVDVEFNIIPSSRIVFNDPDVPMLIYKGTIAPKYQSPLIASTNNTYYIITDEFYGEIVEGVLTPIYYHNSGKRPWFTLGGRAVPFYDNQGHQYIVFQSDFSAAVPYLNDAAVYDNQEKSIMTSSAFPLRFTEGMSCDACAGNGWYYDQTANDEKATCKKCSGTGKKLSFSPLGIYNVVEPAKIVPVDEGKSTFQDPIKYYSPDPGIIQIVNTKSESALTKAEQVLNINRSLLSAQSGVAKEMDREPEYIEVAKISTAMYGHYRHFLQIVQAIRFMDYESTVTVNEPVSFDLKTEVELMAEFKSTQEGMPDSIRLEAFLRLVNERYAQDKIARKLAEICVDYTIFVLYTSAELNERLASGTIVKGDIIKANYVYQAVSDLYYSNQLNLFEEPVETFASIRTKIDTYLNKLIENLGSVNIEDMEDIDLNDDPEL